MKSNHRRFRTPIFFYSIAFILFCALSPKSAFADAPPRYAAKATIVFGGSGGWDDLILDVESHRLFVSHADRITIIDTEKNSVSKEIADLPGIHAIALALDVQKAFSSNGKEGKVAVIDLATLKVKTKISVGENPDAIVYEPIFHEVYAFNGRGRSVSIIDAKTDAVTMTLALPGKAEFAVVDAASQRIFVNIEDKNSILAIDTKTHTVAANWKLDNCESPTGIALDSKNHRLFSVCENARMVMVDSQSGRTVASVATGEGADGAAFDPSLMLAFSSNGKSGSVTIVREQSPEKLTVVQSLNTSPGARTMTLNKSDHKIYLPSASFQSAAKGSRPRPKDGTQKILVYGP